MHDPLQSDIEEFTEEDAIRAEEDEMVALNEAINEAEEIELENAETDWDDFDEEDMHGSHPIPEPPEDGV